jgi:uncharacterized damage-inducible protein DinB
VNAPSILLGLAENNAWANHRLHEACGQLSQQDLRAKRTSFFPSIHETLTHVVLVDEYYVDAMLGGGRGQSIFEDTDPFETFEALARSQRAVDKRLVACVRAIKNGADLDKAVRLERKDHVQVERIGDVLLHLFQHQIHHRGQAHAMLAGTNVKPPQLDEFFLAEELPLRESELAALGLRIR